MQWNATFEKQLGWQTTVRVSYIGSAQQGMISDYDLDMINANNNPFGTTQGDSDYIGDQPQPYTGTYYACDPYADGDCAYSYADNSRVSFPVIGDYVNGPRNDGKSMTNSLQFQAQRKAKNLTYSVAYTYLDQKASVADVGGASAGADHYNPFNPTYDYTRDYFVSTHRVVAYAVYDLPFGHGQHYGANINRGGGFRYRRMAAHDQWVREVGRRVYAHLDLRGLRSCHAG